MNTLAKGRMLEIKGGWVKFLVWLTIPILVFSSCNTKKRPHQETPQKIDPKVEKPVDDEKDVETEEWFAKQNTFYKGSVENFYGKQETVVIDKDSRKVRFTFYRDVSQIDPSIKESAFCRYELSGPVTKIRKLKSVKFHTEHIVWKLDMQADFVEKVDVGPGSDREICATFEKNFQKKLPVALNGLPFFYLFTTPTPVFTLEKTQNGIDPRFSFLKLKTSHQDQEITDWDLEFEPNDNRVGGVDYFNVRPDRGHDKLSRIYDLMEQPSCKTIGSNSINRYLHPLHWFADTVEPMLPEPRDRWAVSVGHCYLVEEWDTNSHVFSMFRVLTHEPNRRVVIHEVEVLDIFQK